MRLAKDSVCKNDTFKKVLWIFLRKATHGLNARKHLSKLTSFDTSTNDAPLVLIFSFCKVQNCPWDSILVISIAKRCSYNSPAQRSNPSQSHPTYSSTAEKGQTEQDQNAGVRITIQNWDIRNNLFRQSFCRSLRKFRNCIKKTLQNISIKY